MNELERIMRRLRAEDTAKSLADAAKRFMKDEERGEAALLKLFAAEGLEVPRHTCTPSERDPSIPEFSFGESLALSYEASYLHLLRRCKRCGKASHYPSEITGLHQLANLWFTYRDQSWHICEKVVQPDGPGERILQAIRDIALEIAQGE